MLPALLLALAKIGVCLVAIVPLYFLFRRPTTAVCAPRSQGYEIAFPSDDVESSAYVVEQEAK